MIESTVTTWHATECRRGRPLVRIGDARRKWITCMPQTTHFPRLRRSTARYRRDDGRHPRRHRAPEAPAAMDMSEVSHTIRAAEAPPDRTWTAHEPHPAPGVRLTP
ncbi:hypothetical protein GCM10014715_71930 [Streptomyces spiralis]|uniref:Uncharacterized protein n=1 Tax=Streptomyces spiralis TaxID=66376 RepID=A0A919AH20_9ACTN|nr:hypothetical protein GCM10014715_71930 [Streptomyces spiralis]